MKNLLPIPDAFEVATGRRIHPATACRYALQGCQGVRLKTWMLGGRRLTSTDAVMEFIEARTVATTPKLSDDSKTD